MPTPLDNGHRSPRKLLPAVVARLLGAEGLDEACNSYAASGDVLHDRGDAARLLDHTLRVV